MSKAGLYSLWVIFFMMFAPCHASSPGDRAYKTISISADSASEDILPGIMHFEGHFLMRSEEWRLESWQATVYGPPERPDKVYLNGSPARFLVTRRAGEGQGTVEATAPEMEYLRASGILKLTGGAVLRLDGEVIRSTEISYNIESGRYLAGGNAGVLIEVPPDN